MTEPIGKQWYIVHTYSGFEERVKENLEQRIDVDHVVTFKQV